MGAGCRRWGAQGERFVRPCVVVAGVLVSTPVCADESPFAPKSVAFGAFAGTLSVAAAHDLVEAPYAHVAYKPWNPELGLRGSYFYGPWLGVEAEVAGAVTRTRDGAEGWGGLGALRVHAIVPLRLGASGFEPFVLVGAGALGAFTSAMGNAIDPAMHAGAGTLFRAAPSWFLRAELRGTATPRHLGEPGELALHPELLVGVTFAPSEGQRPHESAHAERPSGRESASR